MIESMRLDVIRSYTATIQSYTVQLAKLAHERFNHPVWVAGLEGRYYVRGGFAPELDTEDAVIAEAKAICDGTHDDLGLMLLTVENRMTVATSLLRGWITHRDDVVHGILAAERYEPDGTHLSIGAAQ